ncbi:MAG: class I SAM-dependent methyltransferase [Hyphomonadaceae bacterium]
MEDVSTLVARLYEGHPYPPPTHDLDEAIRGGGFQVGDPALWAPMLWPEGRPRDRLKILVAGCGSTQAAWFAHTNRDSEVFGVDLSQASLAHARYLQDKHGLANLHLFKGDLRDIAGVGEDFDVVICTGVLHHMADPGEGMRALARVMAPHAALACMVYAQTRRTGVYMLQDAFRRLGVTPDADGVAFVRRTLAALPAWHFAHFYIQAAPELEHDAALVDTFLHPQDRAYTVPQLLALVEDNGLHFQGWFENAVYYPQACTWLTPELAARVSALAEPEQWAAMEMISPGNYTHYFFARKSTPSPISFADGDWPNLVAHIHPGVRRLAPDQFRRGAAHFTLAPQDAVLFNLCDGARAIGELARSPAAQRGPQADPRALFERLWKQGHVMISKLQASSSTSQ